MTHLRRHCFRSAHFQLGKLLLLATVCPLAAADLKPAEILHSMQRVADWQLANPSTHAVHDWTQAPFYLGLVNFWASITT